MENLKSLWDKVASTCCNFLQPAIHRDFYILRHGESTGNLDPAITRAEANHSLRLTPNGSQTARDIGAFLATHLAEKHKSQRFWKSQILVCYSSHNRGRESADLILEELLNKIPAKKILCHEDSLLGEKPKGLVEGHQVKEYHAILPDNGMIFRKLEKVGGIAHYIFPEGESDVGAMLRSDTFMQKLCMRQSWRNCRDVIIVGHGHTMLAQTAAWAGYQPEWIQNEKPPHNGDTRHLSGKDGERLTDHGYISGNLPLGDPKATQKPYPPEWGVYKLKNLPGAKA